MCVCLLEIINIDRFLFKDSILIYLARQNKDVTIKNIVN